MNAAQIFALAAITVGCFFIGYYLGFSSKRPKVPPRKE